MTRVARGFTLIELMIVVAIVGVLSVVAGTAYRRYMDSARTTEAYSMLGEIRMREEAYRAEKSSYAGWAGSEATTAAFPAVDNAGCTEPCYKDVQISATPPAGWAPLSGTTAGLGINPGRASLQCGYITVAGDPGTAAPGTLGQGLLGTGNQTTPWWYAVAICDNDGKTTKNATFATAFNTTVVSAQNEHQ